MKWQIIQHLRKVCFVTHLFLYFTLLGVDFFLVSMVTATKLSWYILLLWSGYNMQCHIIILCNLDQNIASYIIIGLILLYQLFNVLKIIKKLR